MEKRTSSSPVFNNNREICSEKIPTLIQPDYEQTQNKYHSTSRRNIEKDVEVCCGKDIPGVGGVLPLETSLPAAPMLELELVLLEYSLDLGWAC
ncbi:hypothetical protein QE152_g5358 [Popillia japonica]|uniref:Uncharacterized protein n=1 Tax=Popillia japonica TaxID=7064 RepID=A0AAW1MTA0_POPJA